MHQAFQVGQQTAYCLTGNILHNFCFENSWLRFHTDKKISEHMEKKTKKKTRKLFIFHLLYNFGVVRFIFEVRQQRAPRFVGNFILYN